MLTGDESLRSRPMERIAEPLRRMGARVETTDGHAPVLIEGSDSLQGIDYELPVASAQVKSAVLLAGLNATGATTVVEPAPTRDHTELMLEAAGVRVRRRLTSVTVEPAGALRLGEVFVPGDFSSAAPLFVAAALVPGSDVTVHELGLNPRRTGCSTCSSGWARASRSSTAAAPAASRSATCRCRRGAGRDARSTPTRCRCSSTSCRSSRCSARTRAARRSSAAPPSSG